MAHMAQNRLGEPDGAHEVRVPTRKRIGEGGRDRGLRREMDQPVRPCLGNHRSTSRRVQQIERHDAIDPIERRESPVLDTARRHQNGGGKTLPQLGKQVAADKSRGARHKQAAIGGHGQAIRSRCRARSASTISAIISSSVISGVQPSLACAFAGLPSSTSTSAGRRKAGSVVT